MGKKIITIKLSGENIKICEITQKKNNIYVHKGISVPMPQDIYDDGYIKNVNELAEYIQDILKQSKIKAGKVIFTMNSSRIANREVVLPLVKDSKIKDILEMNSNEYFPVDVREYVFAYSVLERVKTKQEKNIKLLVFAAPDNIIDSYYKLAAKLKKEVVAVDYAGNSSFQIIRNQQENGMNMYIQIGMDTTTITIVHKDKLILQRVITYGLMNIVEAVMESSVLKADTIEKAIEILESEELLLSAETETAYSLERSVDEENDSAAPVQSEYEREAYSRARENITDAIVYLVNNIIRVVDYYKLKNREKNISAAFLAGIGASCKGIHELLRGELDLEIKKVDSLLGVKLSSGVKKSIDPVQMIPNLGAAIAPVKFVSKEIINKKKKRRSAGIAVRILFMSIFASVAIVVTSVFLYNQALLERDEIARKVSSAEEINSVINEYNIEKKKTEDIKAAYNSTITNNEQLLAFIEDLEKYMPSKMQFSNLSCSDGVISMQGITDSRQAVAKLIVNLKALDYVIDVKISQISETEDENGAKTVSFPLSCKIMYLTSDE